VGQLAQATVAGGLHGFAPALTGFVGRGGAMREVAGLLEECRLVTVTGPGGVGKTRLAGEVAKVVAGRFADGVWLAELAAVADPAQVAAVVAAAVRVRHQPGEIRLRCTRAEFGKLDPAEERQVGDQADDHVGDVGLFSGGFVYNVSGDALANIGGQFMDIGHIPGHRRIVVEDVIPVRTRWDPETGSTPPTARSGGYGVSWSTPAMTR
jgi:hypothetical protein